MRRFFWLLRYEFWLAATAVPIHLIVIVQPILLFFLMRPVLVHPTFDLYVVQSPGAVGDVLATAMNQVQSPSGTPYIRPIAIAPDADLDSLPQYIVVTEADGEVTAVQHFGLVDDNQVKNMRNRLTAAGLRLWEAALSDRAVTIVEQPWLPEERPYTVYFGMAMLPLTAFMAAMMIGGILTAQDCETSAILELRLSPYPAGLWLAARLTRLALSGLLAAGLLAALIGLTTQSWPDAFGAVLLILLPVAIVAGCLGVAVGLWLRRAIPTLIISLLLTLVSWIMGGAFGPAQSFGGAIAWISRLLPTAYAVELLFPHYYGAAIGSTPLAVLGLLLLTLLSLAGVSRVVVRRTREGA